MARASNPTKYVGSSQRGATSPLSQEDTSCQPLSPYADVGAVVPLVHSSLHLPLLTNHFSPVHLPSTPNHDILCPQTMKGILVEKTGGPEVLQYRTDLPVPSPKEGQVLVKNTHIGINYIDTYFRTGLYPSPKPETLGKEAAGHVVSLGPGVSTGLQENDRVVWMGTSGGYAEYTVAEAARTIKLPESISSADACAALLQGLTALTLVEEAHRVNRGDWILVLAASGGVGGWLCQILRAKGAHTIAVVGSRQKAQVAKDAGAEIVVAEVDDEKEGEEEEAGDEEVRRVVMEKTGGEGVRAVFDGVGKKTFDRSLELVARKGTMVSFGNASGLVEPFSI